MCVLHKRHPPTAVAAVNVFGFRCSSVASCAHRMYANDMKRACINLYACYRLATNESKSTQIHAHIQRTAAAFQFTFAAHKVRYVVASEPFSGMCVCIISAHFAHIFKTYYEFIFTSANRKVFVCMFAWNSPRASNRFHFFYTFVLFCSLPFLRLQFMQICVVLIVSCDEHCVIWLCVFDFCVSNFASHTFAVRNCVPVKNGDSKHFVSSVDSIKFQNKHQLSIVYHFRQERSS